MDDRTNGGKHMTWARLVGYLIGGLVGWTLIALLAYLITRSIEWWIDVLV